MTTPTSDSKAGKGNDAARPPKPLLVGEVARATGVGVQTLHYYEREGIIAPPARTAAGYRQYDGATIGRIRFVRKAQALGLSLDEIKEVLALAARGTSPCGRVQAALAQKLADVDRRLEQLQSFREELARLAEHATNAPVGDGEASICSIVETATSSVSATSSLEPPRERVLDALRTRRAKAPAGE